MTKIGQVNQRQIVQCKMHFLFIIIIVRRETKESSYHLNAWILKQYICTSANFHDFFGDFREKQNILKDNEIHRRIYKNYIKHKFYHLSLYFTNYQFLSAILIWLDSFPLLSQQTQAGFY